MFRKSELLGAAVVCVAALLVSPMEADTSLVPVGLLAGLAGIRAPTPAEGLIRGSKAGALGGVAFITATGLGIALRMVPVVGAFAVDYVLFTGFAMAVMLIPWYGIAGMVAGPVVQWTTEKAAALDVEAAGDARQ